MSRSLLVRWSPAWLIACLMLSGCYYNAHYDYSVTVTAVADNETVIVGTTVSLTSEYEIDNASVYITDQDWGVTSAPASSTFVLDDDGRDATFLASTPGTYVVRYRTWYYTGWDYDHCYCTDASGYRESSITITVVAAPST
jgi:hypothetical protein